MIGKLKRTLKERCPECKNLLQLREREHIELMNGISVGVSEEYIACSNKNCGYTREIEQKRRRRKDDDF